MRRARVLLLGATLALVPALGSVSTASAVVPEAVEGLESCIVALPCAATLAVAFAGAGVVYSGSSASQQAAMRTAITNAVTRPSPVEQAGTWVGTQLKNSIAQVIAGIQNNIGAGATAVPLTAGEAIALRSVAVDLMANPLSGGIDWGASPDLQAYEGAPGGWGTAGPVADLANYADHAQAIFRVSWVMPAAWDTRYNIKMHASGGGSTSTLTGSPPFYGTVSGRYVAYINGVRFASCAGDSFYQSGDDVSGHYYDTNLPFGITRNDGPYGCSSNVFAGAGDTITMEVWNTTGGLSTVLTSGILSTMAIMAYVVSESWHVVGGNEWQQAAIPTQPSVAATHAADVAALPRSVPIVPGATLGSGTAALGDVVSNPATTVTNVAGAAVPVVGAATTAGSFAGTLTGVSDGIANVANTLSHAFDFSRPVNVDRLRVPATAFSTKFPFSIPFDVVRIAHGVFGSVTPVTPAIGIDMCLVGGHFSTTCPVHHTLDLSVIDPFMPFLRWIELAMIMLGVLMGYRRMVGAAV